MNHAVVELLVRHRRLGERMGPLSPVGVEHEVEVAPPGVGRGDPGGVDDLAVGPDEVDDVGLGDIGASLASGSFRTAGMVIAPCSIKTAAAVAACYADTLISRAADVTVKEGRPLIMLIRETPLHVGHLKMMLALAEMGAVVLPPMPAFYNRPKDLDDIVNHTIARVLDRLDFPQSLVGEWQGTRARAGAGTSSV